MCKAPKIALQKGKRLVMLFEWTGDWTSHRDPLDSEVLRAAAEVLRKLRGDGAELDDDAAAEHCEWRAARLDKEPHGR